MSLKFIVLTNMICLILQYLYLKAYPKPWHTATHSEKILSSKRWRNGKKGKWPMSTYRVYGRKYQDYYLDINAADAYHAIEVANESDSSKWYPIVSDETIEAYEVRNG